MIRSVLALLLTVFMLTACNLQPQEHKYKILVFGTLVEFILYDVDKDKADRLVADLTQNFQRMHRDWHAWKKPGALTELNDAISAGEPHKTTPEIVGLLRDAQRFERLSGGLFNPAIGALIALWGFHSDDKPSGPPPDPKKIEFLVEAKPSMQDISILDNIVSSRNKWVQFDFGGFAKGSALDWASQYLRENGVDNAILNAGGDLNVLGRHGERPWRVGIRHPKNWGVIASVELGPDEVIYTSGNYYRFREHEGLRYSHILDPRTGWPVDHIVSASVIAKNGALADAAATALTVAGPEHWVEVAKKFGVDEVLLVDKNGGLHLTPKMKKRLTIETKDNPIVEEREAGIAGN